MERLSQEKKDEIIETALGNKEVRFDSSPNVNISGISRICNVSRPLVKQVWEAYTTRADQDSSSPNLDQFDGSGFNSPSFSPPS
ncbi:hypothetical protein PC116_g1959 [Phytophthora cactorum]|nr:hypothetical protein PC114_g1784 [Phytophthora cactorum]KAG3184033.1 hypothetical protein C6341_g5179 [Phytophthora cactorum]KAG4052921.1 hypothetical protein PC123_g11933 [Phytophthora cactorum]KAG4250367.1 hypothetical protein PC116_g1959 [Phytophthora cactorum]